jgi:hypothetical protein
MPPDASIDSEDSHVAEIELPLSASWRHSEFREDPSVKSIESNLLSPKYL